MLSSNSFRQFDWKASARSAIIILTAINFSHTIWDRVVIQFNQKSCIMEIAKIDGRIRCGNGNGQCNEHVCMCVSEFNVDLSGSLWATKAGPKFYTNHFLIIQSIVSTAIQSNRHFLFDFIASDRRQKILFMRYKCIVLCYLCRAYFNSFLVRTTMEKNLSLETLEKCYVTYCMRNI